MGSSRHVRLGSLSLPPLSDLRAHLNQANFRLCVGEDADGLDGFIGVFLREGAGLLEAIGLGDDLAGLFFLLLC